MTLILVFFSIYFTYHFEKYPKFNKLVDDLLELPWNVMRFLGSRIDPDNRFSGFLISVVFLGLILLLLIPFLMLISYITDTHIYKVIDFIVRNLFAMTVAGGLAVYLIVTVNHDNLFTLSLSTLIDFLFSWLRVALGFYILWLVIYIGIWEGLIYWMFTGFELPEITHTPEPPEQGYNRR